MSIWTIDYDNEVGPGDEGYSRWWTVSNGERSFRVDTSESDAEWLKAALERAGDVSEAGDLSWEQRERTIAEGKRMAGLPAFLQMTGSEMEAVARRAVGGSPSALAAAVPLVEATLRAIPMRLPALSADDAPAMLLTYEEKQAIAIIVLGEVDPVSQVTAVRVINETLHAAAMRLEQPVAWRRRRYAAPDAPWVYRETPPQPEPGLNLPYEALYRGHGNGSGGSK